MRAFRVVSVLVVCSAAAACGGAVDSVATSTTGSGGAPAIPGGSGGEPSDLDSGSGGSAGAVVVPQEAGLTDARYVDPGCPPVPKQEGNRECDPYAAESTCGPGESCAPYVTYAAKCEPEVVGTQCQAAGTGVQGDDCANGECAPGFVCVSAGSGFNCAKLCTLTGATDDCPPGLICSPLDVPGFFVCG